MTSGLEMEWDYSGRKRRDGQKKKIGRANEKRKKGKVKKSKRWGSEWTRGKVGRRGALVPHGACTLQGKLLFSTLILGSNFSGSVVSYGILKSIRTDCWMNVLSTSTRVQQWVQWKCSPSFCEESATESAFICPNVNNGSTADKSQMTRGRQRHAPLVFENIKTYCSCHGADVWMPDTRHKLYLTSTSTHAHTHMNLSQRFLKTTLTHFW